MRDLLRVGDALLDGPVDGVDQVVVHLQAPLLVAGVEELLAVAGRAAEVDLQHRVAAVGEPLRVGLKPQVSRPHGPPCTSRTSGRFFGGDAGGQRQVAVELQAVARLDT